MPVAGALTVQGLAFWGSVWLIGASIGPVEALVACYAGGVAYLLATVWFPKLHLSIRGSAQLLGYALLLAVVVWGANWALDVLGNSVSTSRTPQEFRYSLRPQFLLAPGFASVGLGALVSGILRQRTGAVVPQASSEA